MAVVARKASVIDPEQRNPLLGASLLRADLASGAADYGMSAEDDIQPVLRALEYGLQELLTEEDANVRLLRRALISNLRTSPPTSLSSASNRVLVTNMALAAACLDEAPAARIEAAACQYFLTLAAWFRSYYPDSDPEAVVVSRVLPNVRLILQQTNPDARIRIANLNVDQVAKLLRNLFELCAHYKVDLRAAIEKM